MNSSASIICLDVFWNEEIILLNQSDDSVLFNLSHINIVHLFVSSLFSRYYPTTQDGSNSFVHIYIIWRAHVILNCICIYYSHVCDGPHDSAKNFYLFYYHSSNPPVAIIHSPLFRLHRLAYSWVQNKRGPFINFQEIFQ